MDLSPNPPASAFPLDMNTLINYFPGFLQHCSSEGPEGPSGFLERLCFEMKKGYKETMLQLLLSPIHIFISDNYQVRNRTAAASFDRAQCSAHVP